ncbi:hypothetical protein BT93_E0715 [Corymbia citriodora subsp. variegata]|nr:hypothetical protein BT93_E0715 [Corymbia citriodora subsp. variegata]
METTSQELLKLEKKESTLSICKNKDSYSQRRRQHLSGKPLTSSVPTSQVLGKAKDFLGVISEANNELQVNAKDNPEHCDIEVLDGNESEIIEMDLMLGIADLHTPEAVAAAESAVTSCYPLNPLASSTGQTDSEDTTDNDKGENDNENSDDDQVGVPTKHARSESGEEDSCGGIGNKRSKKKPKKRTKIIEL